MNDDVRIDSLTGVPVIIVPEREGRPNLPGEGCPFCVGGLEAPEPYTTKAFTNRWPSLGDGRAEVVLFSPDHDASLGTLALEQRLRVVDLWTQRTAALGARGDVGYVLVFENRGAEVGATISHPHGQIYAYGDVPPRPAEELELAAARGTCALCTEEPGDRVIAEIGGWRSWIPSASGHPYGIIIAPVDHLGGLGDLDATQRADLAGILGTVLVGLDALFDESTPYMLWIHQRPTDGRPWPFAHLHVEIVPLRRSPGVTRFVAAAELGSGTLVNSVDPVHAAQALRARCV